MKKLFLFFAVAGMAFLQSCEGPEGEPGFSAESEVFEVANVNFTAANDWYLTYVLDPVILQSDNLLIYELVNTNDNIDTWALLPQVYYLTGGGQMQYNFNYSFDQFSIFIDADVDFNTLPVDRTTNKIFRIVVVPGYFSKRAAIDHSDYNATIKAYGIDDSNVKRLN